MSVKKERSVAAAFSVLNKVSTIGLIQKETAVLSLRSLGREFYTDQNLIAVESVISSKG